MEKFSKYAVWALLALQGRRIIYFTLFVVILFYVYCCNLVV